MWLVNTDLLRRLAVGEGDVSKVVKLANFRDNFIHNILLHPIPLGSNATHTAHVTYNLIIPHYRKRAQAHNRSKEYHVRRDDPDEPTAVISLKKILERINCGHTT